MSEEAVVLICIRGDVVSYTTKGNVKVLVIEWDKLETASRGILCTAYKNIWSLPEDMRVSPLTELIGEVQRRFPIKAIFHPQWWINDYAVDAETPVEFDVTEKLLLKGPDYIDNLRDASYPADELAADLLEQQHHPGPFRIEIMEAAMEFLFADENEAGDAEKYAT